VEAARAIVEAGVAVMGHVGLTPQSVSVLGEPELLLLHQLQSQYVHQDMFAAQCSCSWLNCNESRTALLEGPTQSGWAGH
jgi:ketopantoate hydroxymethyltransferase